MNLFSFFSLLLANLFFALSFSGKIKPVYCYLLSINFYISYFIIMIVSMIKNDK